MNGLRRYSSSEQNHSVAAAGTTDGKQRPAEQHQDESRINVRVIRALRFDSRARCLSERNSINARQRPQRETQSQTKPNGEEQSAWHHGFSLVMRGRFDGRGHLGRDRQNVPQKTGGLIIGDLPTVLTRVSNQPLDARPRFEFAEPWASVRRLISAIAFLVMTDSLGSR